MRSISLVGVLAAAALALAACGATSSSSTVTNAALDSKQAAGLAFSQCMRGHGVPSFPDATRGLQIQRTPGSTSVNGVTVNSPAFDSAMQACRSKLPNGGRPQPPTASQRAAALRFSQCMRSHGVPNFPDPTFAGGGMALELRRDSGIDPNAPAFKAAQQACGAPFGKAP